MTKVEYDKDTDCYFFECPHCQKLVAVQKDAIKCTIFRHGSYKGGKKDKQPIPPHTKKEECDRLVEEDLIYGCGKPFKFDGAKVEICGYI